jgi:DNA-binding beta-propeller fold protein YncE
MQSMLRCLSAAALCAAANAQGFVNYESGPIHPMRMASDGTRLFVADTLGGRLCVFDLRNPSQPFLLAEIPVGMEPVSVQPRTRDEVWVTNLLSDSVSIVSVPERRVIDTLRVVDEPSDVVFAAGKAFVSAATTDQIHVFDATTRASLGTVAIFGKDPRALAVSPDGSRVYAVVHRSGNGTTILPEGVQAPPAPTNPSLPAAPPQGIIVRANDPAWASQIPYSLPDNDVAQINTATLAVTRYFPAVGTTNTAIAVHPTTGDLWVTNIEARNLVRFEPNLRGHAIDSRVTKITTGATPAVTPYDLNVGVNYSQLPNTAALGTALAEPFGVAIDATAGRVYVAAHGTDRIGVLGLNGAVQARIEIGVTPGATVNTRQKRGPRALALHPSQPRLYVLNRLTDTLCVVDTGSRAVLSEQPIATFDPMPLATREGRKFLYDAKLSGNGTMSCAACHIDGDMDGIAWDLGDPSGVMEAAPTQPLPFIGLVPFHPMKGPMTTQTLRGMQGTGLLHWRGDKGNFQAFNGGFATLLGGAQLSSTDMTSYAQFAMAIKHPPNPNQLLDRTRRTAPAGNNEEAGFTAYNQPTSALLSCATCHSLPTGTNGFVINANLIQEAQQMKVPQLRNMYRKGGFSRTAGPQKSGFGFIHDGSLDSLTNFFALPVFNPWPSGTKDDIVTFLNVFDTGTAPLVGYQFMVTQANAGAAATTNAFALTTTRAAAGDCDVTAHGRVDGALVGLLYDAAAATWRSDAAGVGPFTQAQLVSKAQAGNAALAFTCVTPGQGQRVARDRDGDGTLNGDEGLFAYGASTPGCAGPSTLVGNSEPKVGNARFGYVMGNAQANTVGVMALALGQSSLPVIGINVLVDPLSAVTLGISADGFGQGVMPWSIPPSPSNVGLSVYAQALWLDLCGSQLWASSPGLRVTIRP